LTGFGISNQEHVNIHFAESAVTSRADAVCFQYSPVIPPPHRIYMHIEKPSYLPSRQQTI
jgi:hypothetical protein